MVGFGRGVGGLLDAGEVDIDALVAVVHEEVETGGDGLHLGAGCHVAVGGVCIALAEGDVGQLGLHLADGAGGVELISSVEVFALGGHFV